MSKVLFNSQGNIETPTLLLQHKNFETIGNGKITNVSGLTYKNNLNSANELSFKIHKYNDGEIHPLWDYLVDFKIVYAVELNEKFEINVTMCEEDPNDIYKTITGTALGESELSQIILRNVQINTQDDIINPLYDENFPTIFYRNPDDYNSLDNQKIWSKEKYSYLYDGTAYTTEESVINKKKSIISHASLLHRVLEKAPHYSIGEVAPTLQSLKTVHEYSFDETDILSALNAISEDIHCLFRIDSVTRTISAHDLYSTCVDCKYRADFLNICPKCGSKNVINKFGKNTSILVNSTNLTKNITLESNKDSLKNCFYISGADENINAAIANINPNGSRYIYYFSDETLEDMPIELRDKLVSYNELYDEINNARAYSIDDDKAQRYNDVVHYVNDKFSEVNYDDATKVIYPELATLFGYPSVASAWYNATELYYFIKDSMLPVIDIDGMGIDDSISSIQNGISELGGIAVTNVKSITDTSVVNALETLCKVFYSASYYDIDIKTTTLSDYDAQNNKKVWSGTIKLTSHSQIDENNQNISKSFTAIYNVIESTEKYIEQKIMRMTAKSDELKDKQITSFKLSISDFANEISYYSLSELENLEREFNACIDIVVDGFVEKTMDVEYNNSELKNKYMLFYSNRINMIQQEILVRRSQLDNISVIFNPDQYTGELKNICDEVKEELDIQKYLGDYYELFYSYRREDSYNNDNYSSTGLNNTELIDRAKELFEAAQKELYKAGNLQYSITTTMGNLLALPEFAPIVDNFEIGNFIRVGINNKIYPLRLLSYEIQYDSIQDMPVEYSTVEKIYNSYSDVQSVLDSAKSMSTSYPSVKDQVDKSKDTTDTVNNWSKNGLFGDDISFINGENQTVKIDKNGILARSYDDINDVYSLEQLKIVNNGLYTTKDGWKTIDAGVGRFTYKNINGETVEDYGVIAKTVVGNLIIGKKLQIYNDDKSIVIDEEGLAIKGGKLKIVGDETSEEIKLSDIVDAANNAVDKVGEIEDNIYTPNTTTIDGSKITTGSITASQIKTGSISADKMSIGDPNEYFQLTDKNYKELEWDNFISGQGIFEKTFTHSLQAPTGESLMYSLYVPISFQYINNPEGTSYCLIMGNDDYDIIGHFSSTDTYESLKDKDYIKISPKVHYLTPAGAPPYVDFVKKTTSMWVAELPEKIVECNGYQFYMCICKNQGVPSDIDSIKLQIKNLKITKMTNGSSVSGIISSSNYVEDSDGNCLQGMQTDYLNGEIKSPNGTWNSEGIKTSNIDATGGKIGEWNIVDGTLLSEYSYEDNDSVAHSAKIELSPILNKAVQNLIKIEVDKESVFDVQGKGHLFSKEIETENELVLNDLQVYGSISNKYGKIGETTSSNSSSSVSIPSGAWSDTNSRIMLTRGVHIVMGTIIFGACKGGRLGARFASSSGFPQTTNVIPGNITSATAYIQCQWIVTVTEDTEYRLQAWQSTGEDVNITSTYMKAVRIS